MIDGNDEADKIVRDAVISTLKASAPGISEVMRHAIANSIVLKSSKNLALLIQQASDDAHANAFCNYPE